MKKATVIATAIAIAGALSASGEKTEVRIPRWDRFVEITGTHVNLRMAPSTNGEKLTGEYFAKGEVAPLLDETDDWAKVYYAYSPTQYVWLSKQFARETTPEALPREYRFTTYQTYGDQMLTYQFDGKPTNIVYKDDYPFSTTTKWVDEPALYRGDTSQYMPVTAGGIDWQKVMPEIIRTIPDECVQEYFRGVPLMGETHNFRTDHEATEYSWTFSDFIYHGDLYYQLTIHAMPTRDPNVLTVISHTETGLDMLSTEMLKTMRYNIKTGKYSDIRDGLPGVVTDKLGLTYDIFADHPEIQREARQSDVREIAIYDMFGVPMVMVSGPEMSLWYPIDTSGIEGYTQKTNVYYLWNGTTFVKMVRCPYIDLMQEMVEKSYDQHMQNPDESFKAWYGKLTPGFAEACRKADAKTGGKWLDFDPFTFLPQGVSFRIIDEEVVSARGVSDNVARVMIYPTANGWSPDPSTITIEGMPENGTFLISDFKDSNGKSVYELAQEKGK